MTYSTSIEQKKNYYQQLIDEIKEKYQIDNIEGLVVNWPMHYSLHSSNFLNINSLLHLVLMNN